MKRAVVLLSGGLDSATTLAVARSEGFEVFTLSVAIDVPKDRSHEAIGHGIPVTYVPARNTVLLGLCLGYAEVARAFDLFIGANYVDYSGYPDCRPEFLQAFERLANLATKATTEGQGTFRIHAPLLSLTKADIIRLGTKL